MSELTDFAGLTAHRRGDLSYYRLQSLPIRHGFFTRIGGFSQPPYAGLNTAYVTKDPQAAANRELLFNTLGLDAAPLRILNPCHGEKIAFVDPADWQTDSARCLDQDRCRLYRHAEQLFSGQHRRLHSRHFFRCGGFFRRHCPSGLA